MQSDPTTALAFLREIEPLGSMTRHSGVEPGAASNLGVPRGWSELAYGVAHSEIARAVLIHPGGFNSVNWSPDGKRIVTASDDKTARIWPDVVQIRGADDPRLWTGTTYCLTVERRMNLLSVSEATAHADQQACERRVAAARSAPRAE